MLEGSLAPGEQLPSERELMKTFQVGRSAIREALFALNRMGLISLQNGERAIVTMPTASTLLDGLSPSIRHMLQAPDGIRQFQDARNLFEVALARRAAEHATAAEIEQLAAALEANKLAIGNNDAFVETDMGFHRVLAQIARNPVFTFLHSAIATWLKEQRSISRVSQPRWNAPTGRTPGSTRPSPSMMSTARNGPSGNIWKKSAVFIGRKKKASLNPCISAPPHESCRMVSRKLSGAAR
ncbi:MAG: FCD domain-containing protein [Betaproteobacteria bacterium]|nr:FCD domain-containing protein [Betaproteobacteria bacterium]